MKRHALPVVVTLLLGASLAACNMSVSTQPTSTPFIFPTEPPIPTDTLSPTTQPPAVITATPLPSLPTPAPGATSIVAPVTGGARISFPAGGTAADAQGSVSSGDKTTYLVGASAGQFMIVSLSSANHALYLNIQAPDGSVLVSSASQMVFWQGNLPQDGDYAISVVSTSGSGTFDLSITIPVRVQFAEGAISATLDGELTAKGINTYMLYALANQTMTVTITAPDNDIYLTIYGLQDGTPYVRSALGQTHFSFKLPRTQDYVIEAVSTDVSSQNYTIQFVVK
jgi:hypothetical protein